MAKHRSLLLRSLLGCLAPALAAPAAAQTPAPPPAKYDLSHVMPRGCTVYLGCAGGDAKVAGEPTPIAKLLEEPEVRLALQTLWPKFEKSLQELASLQGGGETGEVFDHVSALLKQLAHKPVALGVTLPTSMDEGFAIQAYLVVRAGGDAAAIRKHVEGLLAVAGIDSEAFASTKVDDIEFTELDLPSLPMPVRWSTMDEYFVVTVGDEAAKALVDSIRGTAPALDRDPRFADPMKRVGSTGGYLSVFVDVKAVVNTITAITKGSPRAAWLGILAGALGGEGIETITYAMHPEAGGYMARMFTHVPNVRDTLKNRGDVGPINTEAMTRAVPADATTAWMLRFDPPAVYESTLSSLAQANPMIGVALGAGIAGIEQELGIEIKRDLLAPLGSEWTLYIAPSNGGLWFLGLTAVGSLRNAEHLDQGLTRACEGIAKLAAKEAGARSGVSVRLETEKHRDRTIRYVRILGAPIPVAPAWSIHGDRIIVALYPQIVRAAIDHELDKSPSLWDKPDFQRGLKLMPKDATSVLYLDTADTVRDIYPFVLFGGQVFAAMGRGEKVDATIGMLPSASTLTRHLFGTVAATTITDDGHLGVSHGAVPFSTVSSSPMVAGPITVAVLLPSLARARQQAKRAASMANLRGIGMSCVIYANENDGNFPPDFETLIRDGLPEESLQSPLNNDAEVDYVYVEGQNADMNVRNILAYEKLEDFNNEGTNVLFLDSHVEYMTKDAFDKALAETLKRLGREAPKPGVK